jgi:hypothetical protein
MVRNRAQQIEPSSNYSKPDIRSRATGSIDALRLKTQRATANPNAT